MEWTNNSKAYLINKIDPTNKKTFEQSYPPRDAENELAAGKYIGEYKIRRLIGSGAMGQVFEVEHARLGRHYAMKVLPRELSRDSSFKRRFEQEARTLASLSHNNIVQVNFAGSFQEGGIERTYLIMELLEPFLNKFPHDSILTTDETRNIVSQILTALDYASKKDVVHRDMKPANLLVGVNGEVKVADFGVAQVAGEDFMRSVIQKTIAQTAIGDAMTEIADTSSHHNSSSQYVGTVHYMAPEVLRGGTATTASDLYAVGVMAYEWLTGRKPVGRFKNPSELNPSISAEWDEWINCLLEPEPEDRFRNAAEALDMLPDDSYSRMAGLKTSHDGMEEIAYRPRVNEPEQKTARHETLAQVDGFTPSGPQIRPWVRYFARTMDYLLFIICVFFVLYVISEELGDTIAMLPELILVFIISLTFIPVEAFLLSNWGYTPFKALFNIRVRNADGSKLDFGQAATRSLKVFYKGEGCGIPLINLVTLIMSYNRLKKQAATAWDSEGNFRVEHKELSAGRIAVAIGFAIFWLILISLE